MQRDYTVSVGHQLNINPSSVKKVTRLLHDGATIPFIARYRKEVTGSLDEVAILAIKNLTDKLTEVDTRRQTIITSLEKNNLLSDELFGELNKADTLCALEDLYLPHRPKRRTRAAIARERGLLPLAEQLLKQENEKISVENFLSEDNQVNSLAEALSGARDIIAEMINEDQQTRAELRSIFAKQGLIQSRVVVKNKDKALKFSDYFDWQEPVSRVAGHRLLALYRGESLGLLRVSIRPKEEVPLTCLFRRHLKPSPHQEQIKIAIEDSYKRLLAPSLENDLRNELKTQADIEAIEVFSKNLRELLLASPLGEKSVLALDPGIQAIAIGNGTASRETEQFIRKLQISNHPIITLVNEDGASIYSASETARQEFPDLDLTVRGAISIGRRLQDPLAELVKIDPKSIGVGQYQHDVDQAALRNSLDEVVTSCVNGVGVELNSASSELLSHVSGLGPALAHNIVSWRNSNGPFKSRKGLLKVPRLGAKAFELAAGFLRIRNADNPLDASGVHPERYGLVNTMAKDLGTTVNSLIQSQELRNKIQIEKYISADIGRPTLEDIMAELDKPGRDPRTSFQEFAYAEDIQAIEDLQPGMKLPAIITNVTNFGAFADIGIHQDGLIHISQLADRFVRNPAEIVKVRQHVEVRVLEVDLVRKRISLSMKSE